MNYLMLFKGWTLGKSLPILILFIKLFSGMASLMSSKNWALHMGFPTVITSVGFISTMSLLMSSKGCIPERFSTFTTVIGFLSCMHLWWLIRVELFLKAFPHSSYQYGFSSVWIFLCSNTVGVIPESFPTFITCKRPFSTIYSLMMSKGYLLSKDFLTVFTFVRVSDWSEFSDDLKG